MKKVLCLIMVVACLFLTGCGKKQTIEEITGVSLNQIDHIKYGGTTTHDNDYTDVQGFIDSNKNNKYKKVSGSYGSTTHRYFICYNSKDEVILTLVDVGNSGYVFIKAGEFNINKDASSSLYQLQ